MKSMREFIRENRDELLPGRFVVCWVVSLPVRNERSRERELWILNDEGLCMWAKAEGVRDDSHSSK